MTTTNKTYRAIYMSLFANFASDTKDVASEFFGGDRKAAYAALRKMESKGVICGSMINGEGNRGTKGANRRHGEAGYQELTWQCYETYDNHSEAEAEALAAKTWPDTKWSLNDKGAVPAWVKAQYATKGGAAKTTRASLEEKYGAGANFVKQEEEKGRRVAPALVAAKEVRASTKPTKANAKAAIADAAKKGIITKASAKKATARLSIETDKKGNITKVTGGKELSAAIDAALSQGIANLKAKKAAAPVKAPKGLMEKVEKATFARCCHPHPSNDGRICKRHAGHAASLWHAYVLPTEISFS